MVALPVEAAVRGELDRNRGRRNPIGGDGDRAVRTVASRMDGRQWPSLWQEQRAAWELAELVADPVYYGLGVPRGDGTPVLVLPGFLGSDDYLQVLRGWLRRVGYRSHRSGIAFCAGPIADLLAHLHRRVEAVARAERRPLTLIGHSMGGILSGVLARQRPDLISHVITLGSAMCGDPRSVSHPEVVALGELLASGRSGPPAREPAPDPELFSGAWPAEVKLTCIYSREDAVVDWQACIAADPQATAHEVRGTHSGLAWNTEVYHYLGRALLQAA